MFISPIHVKEFSFILKILNFPKQLKIRFLAPFIGISIVYNFVNDLLTKMIFTWVKILNSIPLIKVVVEISQCWYIHATLATTLMRPHAYNIHNTNTKANTIGDSPMLEKFTSPAEKFVVTRSSWNFRAFVREMVAIRSWSHPHEHSDILLGLHLNFWHESMHRACFVLATKESFVSTSLNVRHSWLAAQIVQLSPNKGGGGEAMKTMLCAEQSTWCEAESTCHRCQNTALKQLEYIAMHVYGRLNLWFLPFFCPDRIQLTANVRYIYCTMSTVITVPLT